MSRREITVCDVCDEEMHEYQPIILGNHQGTMAQDICDVCLRELVIYLTGTGRPAPGLCTLEIYEEWCHSRIPF